MSQTTLEDRLFLGDRAKEVLENEAFSAAFDALEKDIVDQWKASPAKDEDARQKLWQYLQMAYRLRENLQRTLETGKLAKLELQHQQTLRERAKAWLG